MTVEEALVALLTLVAVALLFVGLAQALDTPRLARPRGGPRARPELARRRPAESALDRRARGPRVPLPPERPDPAAAPVSNTAAIPEPAPPPPPPPPIEDNPPPPEPPPPPIQMSLPVASLPEPAEPDALESCVRMFQEGEYAQALEAADAALRSEPAASVPSGPSRERAALGGLAGLARQALGDGGGARQAFEAGLGCAAAREDAGASPRVTLLAVLVARQIVTSAEAAAEAAPDMIAGLGLARDLAEAAAADEPGDDALRELAARAQDAGWTLLERRAGALLGRREFDEAHRVIEEALRSPELPPGRRDTLREVLWTSVTGEVGRLTGQALESAGDLSEVLALMDRAEEAVRRMPPDALTAEQEEDLRRRLWWGHTKLAVERIEGANPEAALPLLYRALGLPDMDAERQAQTRRALARGLEAVSQRVQEDVERLLAAGDHSGAEARGQALCRAIDEAFEQGLSQEELTDAVAKRQHVMALIAGVERA